VEWLERFIEAREQGVTKGNIISGWRGAGLFPENMHRILIQLADREEHTLPSTPLQNQATHQPFFPNSCRPDLSSVHSINQAFLAEISNVDISTPYKTQVRRLCNLMDEYQAETLMLKEELHDVKEIIRCRKEREGGKRKILKDTLVASTQEVVKALKKAEKATNSRKKAVKKTKGKGSKKRVESSEEETESYRR
jgi:hypothetical protein